MIARTGSEQEFSVTNMSEIEAPRIYPTLRYRDAEAMIRWLKNAWFTAVTAWFGMPNLPMGPPS